VKVRTPEGDTVEIVTAECDGEEAVRHRLRTLLQLALAIGKREGLLGNGTDGGEKAAAVDSVC